VKFNMGCGTNRREGYVNVDSSPACGPDEVWDLEQTPWPWADGCAEEVVFIHSLEHMAADSRTFLALMTELYRICAPGAAVIIHAPHPRHDNFLNDPTHVRAITPTMLTLFDREKNEEWRRKGGANTPLALYTGVDFRLETAQTVLDEPYATRLKDGAMTKEAVGELLRTANNVASEFRIRLTARKAAG